MMTETLDEYKDKTFNEIMNSVSFEDIKATYFLTSINRLKEDLSYDTIPEHQEILQNGVNEMDAYISTLSEAQKKEAQTKDTLKNIAYFARIIAQTHPAWEWTDFDTTPFCREVEKLYNFQSKLEESARLKENGLLKEFFRICATTISDNHLRVLTANGEGAVGYEEAVDLWQDKMRLYRQEETTVGDNLAYSPNLIQNGYSVLSFEKLKDSEDSLLVAQKEVASKKIGFVALSSCELQWGSKNQEIQEKQWNNILTSFKENYKDWDCVVIDVRGNGGGDGFQIREIAETLYGNHVPYCLKSEKRKTPESLLREIGNEPIQEDPEWTKEKYPFQGQQKEVFVLTDAHTGSAGEAIVPMLKHYPDIKFIGEHTCGCCQFGGVRPMTLPCGAIINIGSIGRKYEDGMIECKGHQPNIDCSGHNALEVALKESAKGQLVSVISNFMNKKGM